MAPSAYFDELPRHALLDLARLSMFPHQAYISFDISHVMSIKVQAIEYHIVAVSHR